MSTITTINARCTFSFPCWMALLIEAVEGKETLSNCWLTEWLFMLFAKINIAAQLTYIDSTARYWMDGWIPGVFSFWKRNTADGWTAFLPSTQLDIRVRERMAGWKLLCLHLVSSASSSSFIYRSTHYGFLIRWLSVDRRSKMGRRGSESKSHTRRGMGKEKVLGLCMSCFMRNLFSFCLWYSTESPVVFLVRWGCCCCCCEDDDGKSWPQASPHSKRQRKKLTILPRRLRRRCAEEEQQ